MKKLILTCALSILTLVSAFAQSSAVTNAILYHKDKDLAKAKENIDNAVLNSKTMTESKTWYWKGRIYQDLASAAQPDMYLTAMESYNKAIEIGGEDEHGRLAKNARGGLWGASLNAAIKEHTANNFDGALALYEVAMKVKPADTLAYFNATIAAESVEKFDKVAAYNETLLGTGNKSLATYTALGNAYRKLGQDEKAMAVYDKGIENGHAALMSEKVNVLLKLGKSEQAIEALKQLITKDPTNPIAYYNLGFLNDQLNKDDEAEINYKKAIELNPNYEDANFMLGKMYYDAAAVIYNQVGEMSFAEYQKLGASKEAVGKSKMKQAIPYFEKVHSLNPKDQDTMKSLETAYDKVGLKDKREEMTKKLYGE